MQNEVQNHYRIFRRTFTKRDTGKNTKVTEEAEAVRAEQQKKQQKNQLGTSSRKTSGSKRSNGTAQETRPQPKRKQVAPITWLFLTNMFPCHCRKGGAQNCRLTSVWLHQLKLNNLRMQETHVIPCPFLSNLSDCWHAVLVHRFAHGSKKMVRTWRTLTWT